MIILILSTIDHFNVTHGADFGALAAAYTGIAVHFELTDLEEGAQIPPAQASANIFPQIAFLALAYILLTRVNVAHNFGQGLVCCCKHLASLQLGCIKDIVGHNDGGSVVQGNIILEQKLLHAL